MSCEGRRAEWKLTEITLYGIARDAGTTYEWNLPPETLNTSINPENTETLSNLENRIYNER
jgi:hypothetical protein